MNNPPWKGKIYMPNGLEVIPISRSQYRRYLAQGGRKLPTDRCDNPNGPCACGAWHEESDE